MKRNIIKGTCIGVFVILIMMAGMYLGLSQYYKNEFFYNTWINDVYCTGKSVLEVNEELKKGYHFDGLTIYGRNDISYMITAEDIQYSFDFESSLYVYLNKQNPYLWIDNLIKNNSEKNISPVIQYDKEALEKKVLEIPFIKDNSQKENKVVEIRKTDVGYILVNERENVLNKEKALLAIQNVIDHFESSVNLSEAGCYDNLILTSKMQEDIKLWAKISEFQDCGIVYQIGNQEIPIDASIVCDWILLDETNQIVLNEQGELQLDESQVEAFIEQLAETYDSVGSTRSFQATRGEIVSIEGGTYGNKIDRKAEILYLTDAFLKKKVEVHIPEYTQTAIKQGKDDIGDTYIEIDMSNQKLYYYVEGKLIIETPVVTGNTSLRRGTPVGVNYVYTKQQNRVLRGEDYASPVKFWIPVKGNIGIHDASWRSKYGGEIYKTNGSHGCINTPYDAVSELYELVEVGTPCVMFY